MLDDLPMKQTIDTLRSSGANACVAGCAQLYEESPLANVGRLRPRTPRRGRSSRGDSPADAWACRRRSHTGIPGASKAALGDLPRSCLPGIILVCLKAGFGEDRCRQMYRVGSAVLWGCSVQASGVELDGQVSHGTDGADARSGAGREQALVTGLEAFDVSHVRHRIQEVVDRDGRLEAA